jgi:hypothetical protein
MLSNENNEFTQSDDERSTRSSPRPRSTKSSNTLLTNKDTKFTKGLFSILLISTLMTIFELIFYIVLVGPTVKEAVRSLLNNFSKKNLTPELEGLFDTFIYREYTIVSEISIGSYIIIVVEILFLFAFLAYLYMRIQRETRKTYYIRYLNKIAHLKSYETRDKKEFRFIPVDIYPVLVTVIITVTILMSFQIVFFYFGRNFYYTGRLGLEEVEAKLIENLRKEFNFQ